MLYFTTLELIEEGILNSSGRNTSASRHSKSFTVLECGTTNWLRELVNTILKREKYCTVLHTNFDLWETEDKMCWHITPFLLSPWCTDLCHDGSTWPLRKILPFIKLPIVFSFFTVNSSEVLSLFTSLLSLSPSILQTLELHIPIKPLPISFAFALGSVS